MRNQTIEHKNPMNSFLNDSFKNSSEIYSKGNEGTIHTTNQTSLLNMQDENKVNLNISIIHETAQLKTMQVKNPAAKSKLPSLQQGSSKRVPYNPSVYKNIPNRSLMTRSNPRPEGRRGDVRVKIKNSSVPRRVSQVMNKFDVHKGSTPINITP